MARRIYWRVTYTSGAAYPGREEEVSGVFTDLCTLRGAAARLRREFPLWRDIRVAFRWHEL